MGFKITQTIKTINHGELTSFYCRIEKYTIDKVLGNIKATVSLYPTATDANKSFSKYIGDNDSMPSQIATSIIYNGVEFDYPTIFTFDVTTSLDVDEPIYEYSTVLEEVSYLDFDENGDVIEKFKSVVKNIKTQIGTQLVNKKYTDVGKITGNVYEYFYPLVIEEYGKIFGIKNITNE